MPGLTVDVYVDGDLTLEDFAPGTVTAPCRCPPGTTTSPSARPTPRRTASRPSRARRPCRPTPTRRSSPTSTRTGRRTIAKAELPLEEVFRRDGAPRLVLVTCGGDFDDAEGSYRSNVVVTAEPRP